MFADDNNCASQDRTIKSCGCNSLRRETLIATVCGEPRVIAEAEADFRRVYPMLADVPIERQWSIKAVMLSLAKATW